MPTGLKNASQLTEVLLYKCVYNEAAHYLSLCTSVDDTETCVSFLLDDSPVVFRNSL